MTAMTNDWRQTRARALWAGRFVGTDNRK